MPYADTFYVSCSPQDGFVSSGQPVLIDLPAAGQTVASEGLEAPWHGTLQPLSVGYLKGQARVLTLLCAVTFYLDNWTDDQDRDERGGPSFVSPGGLSRRSPSPWVP